MSQPKIAPAGNDPAHNEEVVTPSENLSHDTGDITSTAPVAMNQLSGDSTYFQKMPDNEITNFLERLVEIGRWTITSDDTPLAPTFQFDPWTTLLAKPTVLDKTANYTLIRGKLELTFKVTCPPAAYGRYVISALPNGGEDNVGDVALDLIGQNCMQVDNWVAIDPASSEDGVIQLPWIWPYDWAKLADGGPNNMWKIFLTCLQPIRNGMTGLDETGYIQIFGRLMPGYELAVPKFQGERGGHLTQSVHTKRIHPALHDKLPGGPTKGKVGKVADTVASVADKLTGVPVIGGMAATVATAAHAASKIAHMFGFSRDQQEPVPSSFRQEGVSNVAHYEGPDTSQGACFSSCAEISIDPTLAGGTSEDCAAFASLFARWTHIRSINWASSAAQGALLGSLPVTPFYTNTGVGNDGRGEGICLTTAGYVGLPFEYWRGDMEYKFIIPASKFHRGALQVFWVPLDSAPPTDVTNITLNTIFDVASGENHVVTVGFARELPYLRTSLLTPDVAIWPLGATNGKLYIRVLNPLVSNASADTTIQIFARAGGNMDFAVPRNSLAYADGFGLHTMDWNNAMYQFQGALGDEDVRTDTPHAIVASSGSFPADQLFFGEKITSVRALMQKPSRWWWRYQDFDDDVSHVGLFPPRLGFPQLGILPFPVPASWVEDRFPDLGLQNAPFQLPFTWQGWYRPLFTGVACSERYKLVGRASVNGAQTFVFSAAPVVTTTGDTSAPMNGVSTLNPLCYAASGGYEVQVPWMNPRKFLLGRSTYVPNQPSNERYNEGWVSVEQSGFQGPEDEWAIRSILYHSYGNDLRLVGFRQVPRLGLTARYVQDYMEGWVNRGQASTTQVSAFQSESYVSPLYPPGVAAAD